MSKHVSASGLQRPARRPLVGDSGKGYCRSMDLLSVVIIAGIAVLCLSSGFYVFRRSLDKRADEVQRNDPETARALREARRNIDQGRGLYRR